MDRATARVLGKRSKGQARSVTDMARNVREAREACAKDCAELSAYLDAVWEKDSATRGEWAGTWE